VSERPAIEYIRVDVNLLDELADLIDEHGPVVIAYWIALLLTTKEQKNCGEGRTSARKLMASINGESVTESVTVLNAFRQAELIECDEVTRAGFQYRIVEWEKWQTLTNAEK